MRCITTIFVLLLAASISGCVSFTVANYSADFAAVDSLKRVSATKMAVGKIQPQDPAAKVNHVTLRASTLHVPGGTYAAYLENALITDLTESGLFDSNSKKRIDVTLLRNDFDVSSLSWGKGDIEIELIVSVPEKVLLHKNYSASTSFESSFAGAVAIPKGQVEYPNLIRAVLSKVYSDPEFVQAIRE